MASGAINRAGSANGADLAAAALSLIGQFCNRLLSLLQDAFKFNSIILFLGDH